MEPIKRMEVVNRMLMTKAKTKLNLVDIEKRIPQKGLILQIGKRKKPVTSLRMGRPTMLTWRVKRKEKLLTVLFFPNGTIQCVGNSNEMDSLQVHGDLCELLQYDLPLWKVKSMTALCILNRACDLRLLHSNKYMCYEIELFPAVQFSLWKNVHVHAFHNGKLIITGITCLSVVPEIVDEVVSHVKLTDK